MKVRQIKDIEKRSRRIDLKDPAYGLYLVTERKQTLGRDLFPVIEDALKGGLKWVQLREKDLSGRELLLLAKKLRALTNGYGAGLIINDRLDIALAADADGVHLGQGSFSPQEVRPFLGEDRIIGVSTHNVEEAERAESRGADFITLGPVYFTPSKEVFGSPVGIETLEEVRKKVKVPVFAIGGIKAESIKEVRSSGADGVAVISAIVGSKDVKKSVRELMEEL